MSSNRSFTISHYREDFTSLPPFNGQVEGLGVHGILGKGTVTYIVIDNVGIKTNIIIDNTLYVPTLTTMSLQQLSQQSDDKCTGGHILGDILYLRWNHYEKVVLYHSENNLPVLLPVPGGTKAAAYISKYMLYWNGTYLPKVDKSTTWNQTLLLGPTKEICDTVKNTDVYQLIDTYEHLEPTCKKHNEV